MRKFFLVLAISTGIITHAQTVTEISQLNDEFDKPIRPSWQWAHEKEGFATKLDRFELKDGILHFQPGQSGWFNDGKAPFLYQAVTGDFDVRMRVKATGLNGGLANTQWSLGGLMVRAPRWQLKDPLEPKSESWLFINTGVADKLGQQVVESKYTLNSKSSLKLRNAKTGWVELRMVRVGFVFISMYRFEGEQAWTLQDRYYIQDWPMQLQVGVNGYTGEQADMLLQVDYIRFKKPTVSYGPARFEKPSDRYEYWYKNVSENNLADYTLSNEAVLKLLGD